MSTAVQPAYQAQPVELAPADRCHRMMSFPNTAVAKMQRPEPPVHDPREKPPPLQPPSIDEPPPVEEPPQKDPPNSPYDPSDPVKEPPRRKH